MSWGNKESSRNSVTKAADRRLVMSSVIKEAHNFSVVKSSAHFNLASIQLIFDNTFCICCTYCIYVCPSLSSYMTADSTDCDYKLSCKSNMLGQICLQRSESLMFKFLF